MRKIFAILFVLSSALAIGQELNLDENTSVESHSVKNDYFYFAFNFSLIDRPEVGYRYQSNHIGVDVNFGASGQVDKFFFANLGTSLLVFPQPDAVSQFYLGIELAGSVLVSERYYYSRWRTSFLLTPSLFIGKDYTFSKGQKIFAEISFIPGFYRSSPSPSGWEWLASPGFKIGYGF